MVRPLRRSTSQVLRKPPNLHRNLPTGHPSLHVNPSAPFQRSVHETSFPTSPCRRIRRPTTSSPSVSHRTLLATYLGCTSRPRPPDSTLRPSWTVHTSHHFLTPRGPRHTPRPNPRRRPLPSSVYVSRHWGSSRLPRDVSGLPCPLYPRYPLSTTGPSSSHTLLESTTVSTTYPTSSSDSTCSILRTVLPGRDHPPDVRAPRPSLSKGSTRRFKGESLQTHLARGVVSPRGDRPVYGGGPQGSTNFGVQRFPQDVVHEVPVTCLDRLRQRYRG